MKILEILNKLKTYLHSIYHINFCTICNNFYYGKIEITLFDPITAHNPVSAQSIIFVVFRLQHILYFFICFFIKPYALGTHLNEYTYNICFFKENPKTNIPYASLKFPLLKSSADPRELMFL